MLQTLEKMVQTFAQEIIKSGDTAFATAYKNKKSADCAKALFDGMKKIASDSRNGSTCVGVNPSDAVFKSAIVHWYTEKSAPIDSVADILKGECDICGQGKPKADTPKESKPKASKPTPAPAPAPLAKPAMTIVPPAPVQAPAPMVEDDDDDFDPLA